MLQKVMYFRVANLLLTRHNNEKPSKLCTNFTQMYHYHADISSNVIFQLVRNIPNRMFRSVLRKSLQQCFLLLLWRLFLIITFITRVFHVEKNETNSTTEI